MSEREDWGSWESSEERSYTRGLEVSVEERLAWVEEMLVLMWSTGALPKPRDEWGQPIDGAQRSK
jgi:hypothetical protein